MRAVRQLPFSVEPVVEDRITRVRCRLRYGRSFNASRARALSDDSATSARRVPRRQAARRRGRVSRRRPVTIDSETELRVDGKPVEVGALIGADGANGITARSLGLGGAIVNGVALEGNLPYEELPAAGWRGTLVLELGAVPGGYGWIFPKGDHVNVGVGGWGREGPQLRRHLRVLCDHYGIESAANRSPRPSPADAAAGTVLARGRALVIGDAAGAIDPVSGDGIYEALVTARLAAEHTLALLDGAAETLEPYAWAVRRELDPLASAGWSAKVALDRYPRAVFASCDSRSRGG